MDYTAHGILQARILEWGAFPFSRGDLPNPGIEPRLPHVGGGFFTSRATREAQLHIKVYLKYAYLNEIT